MTLERLFKTVLIIVLFRLSNLDAVPNAVTIACSTPTRYVYGFFRVKKKKINGKMMKPWMPNPVNTVSMYRPKLRNSSTGSSMCKISLATKNMIPMGEYLQKIERLIKLYKYSSGESNPLLLKKIFICRSAFIAMRT